MSRYRRANVKGGTFFFTVAIADRASNLLVREINLLRRAYMRVQQDYPFETVAICILPDHLHAIWQLGNGNTDYSIRWSLIKRGFSLETPSRSVTLA